MLALYGHSFSSYTWKVQIALHAIGVPYDFREIDGDHPEHGLFVQTHAGPLGKFPVLVDGETVLFETTSIIEYLALHHPGDTRLIPGDPDAAIGMRMMDRVFDNYVMNQMQIVVNEYIRDGENPDQARCAEARAGLRRVYAWLEQWLEYYHGGDGITLIECAAAPALFYADWVDPIGNEFPLLKAFRAHLLALPEVSRCVEAARHFRPYFPLGAPDRD
ncbi:MAG: glutathione S-transferase family protein [Novosphingobium sp.]